MPPNVDKQSMKEKEHNKSKIVLELIILHIENHEMSLEHKDMAVFN